MLIKKFARNAAGKPHPQNNRRYAARKHLGPAFPIKTPPLGNLPPREGDYFVISWDTAM